MMRQLPPFAAVQAGQEAAIAYGKAQRLQHNYDQNPYIVPIQVTPREVYISQPRQDYVPIIAITGLLAFFGLIAFLAFMKR